MTTTLRWVTLTWITLLLGAATLHAAVTARPVAWQQVEQQASQTLAVERRQYTPLDVGGRIVLAVQAGRGKTCKDLTARWAITQNGAAVLQGDASLSEGMAVIDFDLAPLKPGTYAVQAQFLDGATSLVKKGSSFELLPAPEVATSGRVPLIFPRGVPGDAGALPLNIGVPMPKGAIHDTQRLRVVDAQGQPVPAQFTVRGRWGYHPKASVRWLGVDLQSAGAPAWWPQRQATPYFLEFGGDAGPQPTFADLKVQDQPDGIHIHTGKLAFVVRRKGFNLIDQVALDGRQVWGAAPTAGPYIVDHEGAIYRAANDGKVDLTIEEQNALRVVVRAEGWYVKDGTDGSKHSYTLPTDRISKFVTRIEAYRGLASVRVLHTWVITYDSYTVRLRDVGLSLPMAGASKVEFGSPDGEAIRAGVPAEGVYLLQHRHNRFDVQTGGGQAVGSGTRSDGNALVTASGALTLGIGLRETWQRFPKEIEVLPGETRLHVWPAHGRTDPAIDPIDRKRYHQLWFAHQGSELNLNFPWDTLFAVMKFTDNPSTGIYKPGGTAMGGVHASAMGAAVTSDIQLTFATEPEPARRQLAAFQARPLALAHPDWLAASGAMGHVHPYDPQQFGPMEEAANRILRSYRALQDHTEEFGMFLYRVWHHNAYKGDGFWDPYRLYSAGHHYEPYMPWLYYARSGDPDHFDHAMATSRQVTDLGLIHYDDPSYPHREFWSRQGRLLGSMRHTNGFVLWGGDHAVFGHLTCYNGFLTGHYLTGDPRLRQVVTEEWQHSILDDRTNPELAKASRLEVGRDNNNSMGELIDLYQLTYDPRLLAYLEPCIERYLQDMKTWGLPLQNLLNFSGHPQAKQQLLEGVAERRKDPKSSLHGSFNGHSPAGTFALASMFAPEQGYTTEVLLNWDLARLTNQGKAMENVNSASTALCVVPDDLLYLPQAMKAVAAARKSNVTGQVVSTQVLPTGGGGIDANYTRVVAKQEVDGPFVVEIKGTIRTGGIPVQVYAPDGAKLIDALVPEGVGQTFEIAADGQTGEYVILLRPRDVPRDYVLSPITSLPQEVYVMGYWSQATATRFFTRLPNGDDGKVLIQSHVTPAQLLSADMTVPLASTEKGDAIEAAVPPDGLWIDTRGVYIGMPKRGKLVLALTPERFFAPSEASLKIAPKP